MQALSLARLYLDAFFGHEPVDGLENLLADDLDFEGPLFRFSTAKAYLDSLRESPPKDASYQIVSEYEDSDSACLIYRFTKPGIDTLMAQYFQVKDGKISKIRLIFDATAFS